MGKIAAYLLSRLLGNWAEREGTLGERLSGALAELITENAIPIGRSLPSERVLAESLAISRGTVSNAYAQLQEDGLIDSVRGSGHMIIGTGRSIRLGSRPHVRLRRDDSAQSDVIDMSSGALPPSSVAREVLERLYGGSLMHRVADVGYFSAGLPELREEVAHYFTQLRLPTQSDNILITSGAKQALWLLAMALLSPADVVVLEDPSYRAALETFRSHNAHIVPVAAGPDQRINLAALEASLSKRPRLAYLFVEASNPLGLSLNEPERLRLADLLNRNAVFLIEDGSQNELHLRRSRPEQPLAALLDPDLVATIGTMSKLFWGGLRLGWIRAAPKLIKTLAAFKAAMDLGNPVLDQVIALQMLARLEEARGRRRLELQRHFASFEEIAQLCWPQGQWLRPDGGTAVWMRLDGLDAARLQQRALRRGLFLSTGPEFSASGGYENALRLPFVRSPELLNSVLSLIRDLAENG